jgi:glycosyltransferase involved in cell wall biosynthesis
MFDTIVNRSCNEGFGLPTLEAMMCGKPIITIKTGGLTRQVEDQESGEQYGIGLDPEVKSLVGNQMVPYIYEDYISHKTLAEAFMKMYEMGPTERKELGLKAMAHAHKDYDINNMINSWDQTLTKTIEDWKTNRPKTWTHTEI